MKVLITYPGRFQPFTINHYKVLKSIKKTFKDLQPIIMICTSDKTNDTDSPFNFKQKKYIMDKLFKLKNVIKTKNPYSPKQAIQYVKQKFDTDDIKLIIIVGQKDKQRLSNGKYFKQYNDSIELQNYDKTGYYYVQPMAKYKLNGQVINGTLVRQTFKQIDDKQKFMKVIYPKFNKSVFKLFQQKLLNLNQLTLSGAVSGFSTPFWHLPTNKKDKRLHIYDKDDVVKQQSLLRKLIRKQISKVI